MKKGLIVVFLIILLLTGCGEKKENLFGTNVGDKYLFVDYEEKMSEFSSSQEIFVSASSLCSTVVANDGIIVTDGQGATDFFEKYSDIFKHPFIESNSFKDDDNAVYVIVSSSKFDPLHFAYMDVNYDEGTKSLYIIFKKADKHTILLNEKTQKALIKEVKNDSKATYTILEFKKSEIDEIKKIYFTVPDDF